MKANIGSVIVEGEPKEISEFVRDYFTSLPTKNGTRSKRHRRARIDWATRAEDFVSSGFSLDRRGDMAGFLRQRGYPMGGAGAVAFKKAIAAKLAQESVKPIENSPRPS